MVKIFIIISALLSVKVMAFMPVENSHYSVLPLEVKQHELVLQMRSFDANKIQILVFFSYGCYWCSKINNPLDTFIKKKSQNIALSVYHYPVMFNAAWRNLAKLYFAQYMLDNTGSLDYNIFQAIHHHGLRLWSPRELHKFIASQGIDQQRFINMFESFEVDMQVHQAEKIANAYQIYATPNIVINTPINSYMTSLSMVNGLSELVDVVDYLVTKDI